MRNAVLAIAALGALAGCSAPGAWAPGPFVSADQVLIRRATRTPTGGSNDGRSGSGFAYPASPPGGYGVLTRTHATKVNFIYGGHAAIPKSPHPKRQIAKPTAAAAVRAVPMAVSPTEEKIVSPPIEQSASVEKQPSNAAPETLGSDDVPPERNG